MGKIGYVHAQTGEARALFSLLWQPPLAGMRSRVSLLQDLVQAFLAFRFHQFHHVDRSRHPD